MLWLRESLGVNDSSLASFGEEDLDNIVLYPDVCWPGFPGHFWFPLINISLMLMLLSQHNVTT